MNESDLEDIRDAIRAQSFNPEHPPVDSARIEESNLLALIELYSNGAQVTMRNRPSHYHDASIVCKPVSLSGLMSVFSKTPTIASGILPENTVFWGHGPNGEMVCIFHQQHRRKILYEGKSYRIPLPPLLFVGVGFDVYMYALDSNARPTMDSYLYYPPISNVFQSGKICNGQNTWGEVGSGNIDAVWAELWSSEFTAHLVNGRSATFDGSVGDLIAFLDGKDEFPTDELVFTGSTLKELL